MNIVDACVGIVRGGHGEEEEVAVALFELDSCGPLMDRGSPHMDQVAGMAEAEAEAGREVDRGGGGGILGNMLYLLPLVCHLLVSPQDHEVIMEEVRKCDRLEYEDDDDNDNDDKSKEKSDEVSEESKSESESK